MDRKVRWGILGNAWIARDFMIPALEASSVCELAAVASRTQVPEDVAPNAKHYSDQFRWHLFSFELLNAVKGEDAGTKFDAAEKDELFLFFDYDDSCYRVTGADKLTVKDIMELQEYGKFDSADRYFFDPKRKWCYIMTHETEWCGPYFYHL